MQSIFSTYTKDENRVTSTIMAVFSKLSLNSLNFVLQRICGDETFQELISFTNQKYLGSNGKDNQNKSIPDAEISASFQYLFETKVVSGAFSSNSGQLKKYIGNSNNKEHTKLIVLTPDADKPEGITNIDKVYWLNFDTLYDILNELLVGNATSNEQKLLIFEYERFLINELLQFFIAENLLAEDFKNRVLVVPANIAWDFYKNHGCYICQPNRTFRNSNYMAFYSDGKIQKETPQILGWIDSINFDGNEIQFKNIQDTLKLNKNVKEKEGIELIKEQLKKLSAGKNPLKGEFKVVFLRNAESLDNEVENNKTASSGKRTAFTQKQVYVSFEKLKKAKSTSELELI